MHYIRTNPIDTQQPSPVPSKRFEMAEGIRAATAATSSGVSILKILEERARGHYERKDLVSDNVEKLVLVQELLMISLKASARLIADQRVESVPLKAWKLGMETLDRKL